MTLYDLTVKQVESWVAVYKRGDLIGRFGTYPLWRDIDILSINCLLWRLILFQDCKKLKLNHFNSWLKVPTIIV